MTGDWGLGTALRLRSVTRDWGLGTALRLRSVTRDWGHFGKLSASLGTLRQAQCIAGDTSASSVHRWGLRKMGRIITPNS
ncbi:MAG: hypothetical protein HEQ35_17910 [Gloeotrichia echinulata IR180]